MPISLGALGLTSQGTENEARVGENAPVATASFATLKDPWSQEYEYYMRIDLNSVKFQEKLRPALELHVVVDPKVKLWLDSFLTLRFLRRALLNRFLQLNTSLVSLFWEKIPSQFLSEKQPIPLRPNKLSKTSFQCLL